MAERDPSAVQRQPRDPPAQAAPPRAEFCVVGIGASAGGLEACRRFLETLPDRPGMAFILVQHLDPTHDSMMVELLSGATTMPVVQAQDGMGVAADHVYVIPPGQYLAFKHGRLSLTPPPERHGARLPVDFLLNSLAAAIGVNVACVILSGGGADGAIGARAIKAAGGLVVAQADAEHGAMPGSVIATGAVDFILPAAQIGVALMRFAAGLAPPVLPPATPGTAEIVKLLKALTPHDFSLYKSGTLDRRIARRMSLAGFGPAEADRYLERLKADEVERAELANDLLINVTGFFRDPKIFELLAETTIPELVKAAEGPIRLWVAGCSTGEETYSLAMLLLEQIKIAGSEAILQVFATDVDARAVALAREGCYPATIEKEVSPARLARFFDREEHGYRVTPALRACVVFAVQDVLSDPPFSKLNMVSCRNLLIYLQPEAQAKIIAVFNFALLSGGYLLLGAAETVSAPDRRFEKVTKAARLYRKVGRGGAERLPSEGPADFLRLLRQPASQPKPPDAGEICRKLMLERYAPAALLVNAKLECLYVFGPVDAFLRAATGPVTHDLLAQLPSALRVRVRKAVPAAFEGLVRVEGGRVAAEGRTRLFDIEMQPVPGHGDKLLVCFLDQSTPAVAVRAAPKWAAGTGGNRVIALENELKAANTELELALHSLETATEEHNAINEEALSVNEEFQSTNEELLTSKEELQSLNEELTALNSQLQETLERSRSTSADLRNVLYSTDVPTLFLDQMLNIRFFTPSATTLFHIIQTDIGRRLEDFRSLADDAALLSDARQVLETGTIRQCEIFTQTGIWYVRRIQPYRGYDGAMGGVVITFADVTERKAAAAAVEAARAESERANLAKTRFLAAASHDLRQPLQTMALINGLLRHAVEGDEAKKLVLRLDNTMQSVTVMLDAMLDINQIEAGVVKAQITEIQVDELLSGLSEAFADQAAAQQTELRVIPCGLRVASDPALLSQMLTNLVGNALKYTKAGRVLLGCRRHGEMLRIEVWDTGIGIAADQLSHIFDEYHQIDNAARERSLGLGLGLSIVHRLGMLLGHKISVRSVPGKGSGFSVELPIISGPPAAASEGPPAPAAQPGDASILVIEDDPDIRQLLESFLTEEGFSVAVAGDGNAAKQMVFGGAFTPDLILADFNLPGGESGLRAALDLRARLRRAVPVIIMTGDISTATLRLIADEKCVQMNKPMRLGALMETIGELLAKSVASRVETDAVTPAPATSPPTQNNPLVFIIDDDEAIRHDMRSTFQAAGTQVESFPDAESFLAALPMALNHCCVLVDAALPGMSGLQFLRKLGEEKIDLPAVMVTGQGDIALAVRAMKAGAADFLEKPVAADELLACVRQVLDQNRGHHAVIARRQDAAQQFAGLTMRQREVMDRVLAGEPSKNIAADLGISQRTVETHRASIMQKTGAKSIPALARLAVTAALPPVAE